MKQYYFFNGNVAYDYLVTFTIPFKTYISGYGFGTEGSTSNTAFTNLCIRYLTLKNVKLYSNRLNDSQSFKYTYFAIEGY